MNQIKSQQLISYGLLAFCLSFVGLPIYIYLPNYYADNYGLSLKTIALVLLATRFIDTFQDPLFGWVSDRLFRFKKKIIYFFSPLLGISFLFLFQPLDVDNVIPWVTIFLVITYSFFSIIYINYQSYAVALSSDYHLKTKIISYREIFFVLGIIFAAASPAILFQYFGETQSFLIIGVVYLVLIIMFSALFYYKAPQINHQKLAFKGSLKLAFSHSILRNYFIIFLLNSVSSSIPAVLIIFFVESIIGAKHLLGLFLILYFFGLLFGVFLWTRLSKILDDKVKTFLISMLFTVFAFVWCYTVGPSDVLVYSLVCFFSGVGFGGDLALAYSILTDIIQKYKLQSVESTLFGLTNFLIKISLTVCSGFLIYFIGSLESIPQAKVRFISLSYIFLPIIFRVAAVLVFYKTFKLNKL